MGQFQKLAIILSIQAKFSSRIEKKKRGMDRFFEGSISPLFIIAHRVLEDWNPDFMVCQQGDGVQVVSSTKTGAARDEGTQNRRPASGKANPTTPPRRDVLVDSPRSVEDVG
jgi:hypothetical protein